LSHRARLPLAAGRFAFLEIALAFAPGRASADDFTWAPFSEKCDSSALGHFSKLSLFCPFFHFLYFPAK